MRLTAERTWLETPRPQAGVNLQNPGISMYKKHQYTRKAGAWLLGRDQESLQIEASPQRSTRRPRPQCSALAFGLRHLALYRLACVLRRS